MKKERKWLGTWPAKCDMCGEDLKQFKTFVDGATIFRFWALMCPACHVVNGTGIGTGKGQRYDAKTLIKLEG